MRLFTLIWAAIILVGSCTSDSYAFVTQLKLNFVFKFDPDFNDLFKTDINVGDKFYMLQKLGHITGFFILYLLLYKWVSNYKFAIAVCAFFAVFTEFIQLYFDRHGRLYDVGVDMVGIFLGYAISIYGRKKPSNEIQ